MNIGLNSDLSSEDINNLKKDDILYSAYYDNGSKTTDVTVYTFEEYIKSPKDESSGIWARLKDTSDDKTYALDLTKGLYKKKYNAAKALLEALNTMVEATEKACELFKKEND